MSEGDAPRPPGWFESVGLVISKDVALERATGEVTTTSVFFAVLVTVVSSLAFHAGPDTTARAAPAVIWLAVAFASVLAISRAWHRERDESALDGLVVSPLPPSAIFAGKALVLALFVVVIQAVVVPVAAVLFGFEPLAFGVALLPFALLADLGIAATGTLFGVMTVRTRARDLLLSTVLLPLLAPSLGTAIVVTRELVGGVPVTELADYAVLLGVFDLVFCVGGLSLFGSLIES